MTSSTDSVEPRNHRWPSPRKEPRGHKPPTTLVYVGDETVGSKVVSAARAELITAAAAYHAWIAARLETLLGQVNYLSSDLLAVTGIADAKRDWLTAHLTYETLGTVKRTFGPLDKAINEPITGSGLAASGDTSATGFHKVEALLWSGARMAEIKEAVNALRMLVLRLVRHFQAATVRPTTIPTGLSKAVEAAIQVELSGHTDAGSHTSLATISANLSGAADALSFITPVLETRYPRLRETLAAFASSQALIQTFTRSGVWVPLHDLTATERDRLRHSLQDLAGLLTPIATICRGIR